MRPWKALEDLNAHDNFNGRQGFIKLAIRILSIIANSAGCERGFTKFGNTHTKHRNRMSSASTHDITTVRMDIDREHAHERLARPKRKFGGEEDSLPLQLPRTSFESVPSNTLTPNSSSHPNTLDGNASPPELNYPIEFDDRATDFDHIADSLCEEADVACAGIEDDHTNAPTPHTSSSVPAYKPIPIRTLFAFPPSPTDPDSNIPLEFFFGNLVSGT